MISTKTCNRPLHGHCLYFGLLQLKRRLIRQVRMPSVKRFEWHFVEKVRDKLNWELSFTSAGVKFCIMVNCGGAIQHCMVLWSEMLLSATLGGSCTLMQVRWCRERGWVESRGVCEEWNVLQWLCDCLRMCSFLPLYSSLKPWRWSELLYCPEWVVPHRC